MRSEFRRNLSRSFSGHKLRNRVVDQHRIDLLLGTAVSPEWTMTTRERSTPPRRRSALVPAPLVSACVWVQIGTPVWRSGQATRLRVPQSRELGDGYASTAPANGGPQPAFHADCPVNIQGADIAGSWGARSSRPTAWVSTHRRPQRQPGRHQPAPAVVVVPTAVVREAAAQLPDVYPPGIAR